MKELFTRKMKKRKKIETEHRDCDRGGGDERGHQNNLTVIHPMLQGYYPLTAPTSVLLVDNYTFAQPGIQRKVKALEELVSRIDESGELLTSHCTTSDPLLSTRTSPATSLHPLRRAD
ncbi:hypothetical protein INR49_031554 [Caranx melampygus]|nr:hypothetical protein INR49_031554 [Caranx melampygus]